MPSTASGSTASDDVTRLLLDFSGGDREALDRLLPCIYDELREIARRHLRRERSDHTLGTTALVHEAYLKLVDVHRVQWQDRAHFFAVAATAMRHILVDYARTRNAAKRGDGRRDLPLDEVGDVAVSRAEELVALDEALTRLSAFDPRKARIVECRYFAGLSIEETAAALDVSPTTVKLDWRLARTWLYRELHRGALE